MLSFARPLIDNGNFATEAQATPTTATGICDDDLLGGREPILPARMQARSQRLCYLDYTLRHSGTTRTALWSAQKLTRSSITAARAVPRTNEFYPEPRLPRGARAELADYVRSGYDRGHLVPSADMPRHAGERESFALANIVPQTATLNRNAWADLERDVRAAASRHGEAYVVTGPLFIGSSIETLRGRVYVPTHLWKAVHVPGRGTVVMIATNNRTPTLSSMPLSLFESRYGIDPFPALDERQKNQLLSLGGRR